MNDGIRETYKIIIMKCSHGPMFRSFVQLYSLHVTLFSQKPVIINHSFHCSTKYSVIVFLVVVDRLYNVSVATQPLL
jgi:hypothetical protein